MTLTLFRSKVIESNGLVKFERESYPVIRETLKCYVINYFPVGERHILKESRRRFAYPTTKEADESAIERYRWAMARRIRELSTMIVKFAGIPDTTKMPISFDEEGWPDSQIDVYDKLDAVIRQLINEQRYKDE